MLIAHGHRKSFLLRNFLSLEHNKGASALNCFIKKSDLEIESYRFFMDKSNYEEHLERMGVNSGFKAELDEMFENARKPLQSRELGGEPTDNDAPPPVASSSSTTPARSKRPRAEAGDLITDVGRSKKTTKTRKVAQEQQRSMTPIPSTSNVEQEDKGRSEPVKGKEKGKGKGKGKSKGKGKGKDEMEDKGKGKEDNSQSEAKRKDRLAKGKGKWKGKARETHMFKSSSVVVESDPEISTPNPATGLDNPAIVHTSESTSDTRVTTMDTDMDLDFDFDMADIPKMDWGTGLSTSANPPASPHAMQGVQSTSQTTLVSQPNPSVKSSKYAPGERTPLTELFDLSPSQAPRVEDIAPQGLTVPNAELSQSTLSTTAVSPHSTQGINSWNQSQSLSVDDMYGIDPGFSAQPGSLLFDPNIGSTANTDTTSNMGMVEGSGTFENLIPGFDPDGFEVTGHPIHVQDSQMLPVLYVNPQQLQHTQISQSGMPGSQAAAHGNSLFESGGNPNPGQDDLMLENPLLTTAPPPPSRQGPVVHRTQKSSRHRR